MNFKFRRYSRGPPKGKPIKFSRKGSVGVYRHCLSFSYPVLSQERQKLRIWNLASTLMGSIRTKSH